MAGTVRVIRLVNTAFLPSLSSFVSLPAPRFPFPLIPSHPPSSLPTPHPHSPPPVETAVRTVNSTLEQGDADQTLAALQDDHLDLSDVHPQNKLYYQQGLLQKKREKAQVREGWTLV